MKVSINDLDIYQKSWTYGMQRIAEKILCNAYNADPDRIVITVADFNHLVFKGYDVLDWNKKFVLKLKISYELNDKGEKDADKKENGSQIGGKN